MRLALGPRTRLKKTGGSYGERSASRLDFYHKPVKTTRRTLTTNQVICEPSARWRDNKRDAPKAHQWKAFNAKAG